MPLTERQIEATAKLDGVRLAIPAHLEHKMTRLFEGLLEWGAAVFLTTRNPSTVRDDVVEHLVARGAEARAWNGMSADDERSAVTRALDWKPTHLCEMGAELTSAIVDAERTTNVRASLEATRSGITKLARLESCGRKATFPGLQLGRLAHQKLGQSVSDFAISTLVRAAREVIREHDVTELSDRDRDLFISLLEDADASANETLRAAADHYKKELA